MNLNCRYLSDEEKAWVFKEFQGLIDAEKIQIYNSSYVPLMCEGVSSAPNGNIYFSSLSDEEFNNLLINRQTRKKFTHELAHVLQSQQTGQNLVWSAAHTWSMNNFNYSEAYDLPDSPLPSIEDYGLEQQADLIERTFNARDMVSVLGNIRQDSLTLPLEERLTSESFTNRQLSYYCPVYEYGRTPLSNQFNLPAINICVGYTEIKKAEETSETPSQQTTKQPKNSPSADKPNWPACLIE
ncbi:MAG: hypothetical protein CL565_06130 [Alphaproteobacteria bacterium]|nr:hypothetical protein [Alphaproteobacteria bacterium]